MFRKSFLALALLFASRAAGTVVGVDIGSSAFKASLAQPGKAPAVLINPQSKRSTPTALMLQSPPRLVGSPAITMGAKYPYELIELAHNLAGVECNSHEIPWPTDYYSYGVKCDALNNRYHIYVRESKMKLWPEEVIAHYLDYIKGLAIEKISEQSSSESVSNAAVKKMVFNIALPVGSTYRQFLAYQNAARIAGVKTVDNFESQVASAAAFHSTDLNLEEDEEVRKLILDIGALNAQACLVKWQRPKNSGVISSGIRTFVEECRHVEGGAGGLHGDWVITDHIMKEFEKQHGRIKGSKRDKAIKRALAEANKKKHVLSVNKSTKLSIENLDGNSNHVDISLTRTEFEEMLDVRGFYDKITNLVSAFDTHQISLTKRIKAVEWIGNGWRIPSIQERLAAKFPDLVFQTTINQDESHVLGALYLGSLDNKYKTPKVYIEDWTNPNTTMSLSGRFMRDAHDNMSQIQREDKQREALEQARNDFEEFVYKSKEILSDESKYGPIIEEEAAELAKKADEKEGRSWLGGILGGGRNPETTTPPAEDGDTTDEDGDTTTTTTTASTSMDKMTIAERIPKALSLANEAQAWLEESAGETFDRTKGLKFKDDLKSLMSPLMERLKQRKQRLAAERKARLAEKKAARANGTTTEDESQAQDQEL